MLAKQYLAALIVLSPAVVTPACQCTAAAVKIPTSLNWFVSSSYSQLWAFAKPAAAIITPNTLLPAFACTC